VTLPLIETPNVGVLIQWFLLAQEEITDIVEAEVYRTPPENQTFPQVRVSAFAGASLARSMSGPMRFFHRTPFQIDAYGGDEELAHLLAERCAAALEIRLSGTVTFGGVTAEVTSIEVSTPRPMPAEQYPGNDVAASLATPAKPRFVIDGVIYAAVVTP
jgi:hypothetical protein